MQRRLFIKGLIRGAGIIVVGPQALEQVRKYWPGGIESAIRDRFWDDPVRVVHQITDKVWEVKVGDVSNALMFLNHEGKFQLRLPHVYESHLAWPMKDVQAFINDPSL